MDRILQIRNVILEMERYTPEGIEATRRARRVGEILEVHYALPRVRRVRNLRSLQTRRELPDCSASWCLY